MAGSKIKSVNSLLSITKQLKKKGKRIVFTNGCFDIIHAGHTIYLKKAKALGDALIVALNTDASVRRLKGNSRPLVSLKDRLEVVSSLESVDYVTSFGDETPRRLIELIKPYVLAKGGDWSADKIIGADIIISCGGKVVSIPYVAGHSTSGLIKKIKDL